MVILVPFCSGRLADRLQRSIEKPTDRMQQQTRSTAFTYRFNDAGSGCHLSPALMATPGTENKHTNRPNVNPRRFPIAVSGIATVLCGVESRIASKQKGGGKTHTNMPFSPLQQAILCELRIGLQRRTGYAHEYKPHRASFPKHLSVRVIKDARSTTMLLPVMTRC